MTQTFRRLAALAASMVLSAPGLAAAQAGASVAAADDPFRWLEPEAAAAALDWVKAQNARTLGILTADPRYPQILADVKAARIAYEGLPSVRFVGRHLYSFGYSSRNPRGVWKATSLASYLSETPSWSVILNMAEVPPDDAANWVYKSAECDEQTGLRCMIGLSDDGRDAVAYREFDLDSKAFVDGGFALPLGSQTVVWEDKDTLLVSRDWGGGTVTPAGYPFVVKRWRRGEPLSAAREAFRGKPGDVSARVTVLKGAGRDRFTIFLQRPTTFATLYFAETPTGLHQLDLPRRGSIAGVIDGRALLRLAEDWWPKGARAILPKGALVSVDLKAVVEGRGDVNPQILFRPGPRQALASVDTTASRVLVTYYDQVAGRAAIFTPRPGGGWARAALPLPAASGVTVMAASEAEDVALLKVEGDLVPATLFKVDTAAAALTPVRQAEAAFDAEPYVTEQYEARSRDGTRIPYRVIRARDMAFDGQAPTIMLAYGGYARGLWPSYSATTGKVWLARGGVYVVAGVRGGGEYGPDWHQAAQKAGRQRSYDDFAAVAEDLIARKITSPRRLGIRGSSNGGLLMGVEMVQRPDLWTAVDIQAPLLDMLRFKQMGAGASWTGEFGDPDDPAERPFLAATSPYHNLTAGVAYPEPFILSSTADDRVGPGHARKMAAKMSAMGLPYLYYEPEGGGHLGAGDRDRSAAKEALIMTYFVRKLMD